MSKGDTFENDFVKLIFQASAIANIADNAATSPLTNLYLSLHTADPGEAGSQTTSEATYTSYARVAVARTSGGFTISGKPNSGMILARFSGLCWAGDKLMDAGVDKPALCQMRLVITLSMARAEDKTPEPV